MFMRTLSHESASGPMRHDCPTPAAEALQVVAQSGDGVCQQCRRQRVGTACCTTVPHLPAYHLSQPHSEKYCGRPLAAMPACMSWYCASAPAWLMVASQDCTCVEPTAMDASEAGVPCWPARRVCAQRSSECAVSTHILLHVVAAPLGVPLQAWMAHMERGSWDPCRVGYLLRGADGHLLRASQARPQPQIPRCRRARRRSTFLCPCRTQTTALLRARSLHGTASGARRVATEVIWGERRQRQQR